MYCKECGAVNKEGSIYCNNDGFLLQQLTSENLTLSKANVKFCSHCGCNSSDIDSYCSNCGVSFFDIVEHGQNKALPNINPIEELGVINSKLSMQSVVDLFRRSWLGSLISIITLLALSKILGVVFSDKIRDFIEDEIVRGTPFAQGVIDISLSVMDLILLSNLVGLSFGVETSSVGHGTITARAGFVLFMILPFLSFFVGGYFLSKKRKIAHGMDMVMLSIGMGITNAFFMVLVALLAGTKGEYFPKMSRMVDPINYSLSYSLTEAFIHGFVIGCISSFLGLLLALNLLKTTAFVRKSFSYGESFNQSIITISLGFLVSFITVALAINTEVEEKTPLAIWFLLTPQGASYLFNIAHFNTFTLSIGEVRHYVEIVASVLGGIESEKFGKDGLGFLNKYVYATVVFLFAMLFRSGYKIAKYSTSVPKSILVFSGVYAVLMTFIAALSRVNLRGEGEVSAFSSLPANVSFIAGFDLISTFLMCFLVSGFVAYLGATFKNQFSK